MNEEQRAAFLNSQSACAMIEAMGMQAENQYRTDKGLNIAYDYAAFEALIDKYCLGHNPALLWLQGR